VPFQSSKPYLQCPQALFQLAETIPDRPTNDELGRALPADGDFAPECIGKRMFRSTAATAITDRHGGQYPGRSSTTPGLRLAVYPIRQAMVYIPDQLGLTPAVDPAPRLISS
jgi:hypothetical protein